MMKKNPDLDNLVISKNRAIISLDFEKAYDISQQLIEKHKESFDNQRESFMESLEEGSNIPLRRLELQKELITLTLEQDAQRVKQYYHDSAILLAKRQREEESELERKWREAYQRIIKNSIERTESSMISAKILAKCDLYQPAIALRDSSKQNDKKLATEICENFQRQFNLMYERHEHEFEQLHCQMKSYMLTLKKQRREMELAAESRFLSEESEKSARAITTALSKTKDDKLRKEAFQHFSPKKRGIPVRRKSTSSRHSSNSHISNNSKY